MTKLKTGVAWSAWGDTDPGKMRENNEDRIHCDPERGIFLVVDGMGGEAAGEVAAQNVLDWIVKRLKQDTGTIPRRMREAVAAANNEVYRLAQATPEWRGMACVLTLVVLEEGTLHVAHVGDSRLYVVRNHTIRKATPDHSPVGRREDAGEITELEAMRHPRRNEVFRDVGSQPHKPEDPDFIEYVQFPFESDSALVLCSDGLSDMATSSEILRAVELNAGRPRDSVRDLIRIANAAGGKDNVSVIVVEAEGFATNVRGRAGAEIATPSHVEGEESSFIRVRRPGAWRYVFLGVVLGAAGMFLAERQALFRKPAAETHALEGERAGPRMLVVSPAGGDLTTIVQALEQSRPGDRILVAPGEYREPVRMKDGVAIAAQTAGEVVLRVAHPLALDDAAVIADGIKGAELSGFVIRAGPEEAFPVGIRIMNSDVRITNVEVSGAASAGIWIGGHSRATLVASYVYNNPGTGIVIAGTARPRIVGNIIQGNGTRPGRPGPGIDVIESADPAVLRNVISGNAAEGIRLRVQEMKERMAGNFFGTGARPNKGGAVAVVIGGR